MKSQLSKLRQVKMKSNRSADQSKTIHRDFLGAHRYTTRGGMCVLRRPLHGAGCLPSVIIRGNNLSPSLRYPIMHFAFVEALRCRASTITKFYRHLNALVVSTLASIEVLEYNKTDLQRMLEHEAQEKTQHRKQEWGAI